MAIIKCKMCGGNLDIASDVTVAECEYCGTQQTVPSADNEKKMSLFSRANRLRLSNEFDKAAGVFETIVADFPEEAEAYWGLVLCRYGIEYVDDPATGKKIPTCHRSSFDSVMSDSDYEQTLENADPYSRRIYREEAKQIEQLRKDIIAASANEEPYDIFICYKETAPDGQRTLDSVLAQDIYDALTDKGYRVFFARITLEDKLGTEYEPVIFAALHSARIMLAVGTDYEYFNAVWVKNEWGRYLKLMEKDREKHLIPCYKGIDAYDMPPEFAKLQAQDLGKVGATQDLLRGVEKILRPQGEPVKETVILQQAGANVSNLLDRAHLFMEDGDWESANGYLEKVLDEDSRNAEAYLGKLMVELKVRKKDNLPNQPQSFDDNANYQKAMRFGDAELKATLEGYIDQINIRNEQDRLERLYAVAVQAVHGANSEKSWLDAAYQFEAVGNFRDSQKQAEECREKAETVRKDDILAAAAAKMSGSKVASYQEAITLLSSIAGWKNANDLVEACKNKIGALEEAAEAERQRQEIEAEKRRKEAKERAQRAKKAVAIVLPITCLLMALVLLINCVIIPMIGYNKAVKLMDAGQYSDAISEFQKLDGWRDSQQKINDCSNLIAKDNQYNDAVALMNRGELNGALALFLNLGDHRDSAQLAANCQTLIDMAVKYETACAYMEEGKYGAAMMLFAQLGEYQDSADRLAQCQAAINDVKYDAALALMDQEKYEEAITAFEALNGYSDSVEKIAECQQLIKNAAKYQEALALMKAGKYAEAITAFEMIADYKDSKAKSEKCLKELEKIDAAAAAEAARKAKYNAGVALMEQGEYEQAIETFKALNGYKDSAAKITACENAIKDQIYNEAVALMNQGKYAEALTKFQSISGYKDSATKANECAAQISAEDQYQKAVALMNSGKYEQAITAFKAINGYKDSNTRITECENAIKENKYNAAVALMNQGKYEEAITAFQALNGYKDSASKITQCQAAIADRPYQAAVTLEQQGKKAQAAIAFWKLGSYKDARTRSFALWDKIANRETISAGGYHTVGLKADGTVVAVGEDDFGKCNVTGWTDIIAISAGNNHTLGLKADGTVVAVGYNSNGSGQCNVTGWTDIVAISAGYYHTVGLKADGTVVAVGLNEDGQCNVTGWTDIVAISAGNSHTVGLKADGTVVAVGSNDSGQCDVTGWRDIVAISAGGYRTVGLKANDTVVAIGAGGDDNLKVSGWTDIVAISAGGTHTLGLKADGTVVAVGSNSIGQCNVTGWRDIVAISAGGNHTVGLKADGTVVAKGNNYYGQCGVTGWTNIKLPNT